MATQDDTRTEAMEAEITDVVGLPAQPLAAQVSLNSTTQVHAGSNSSSSGSEESDSTRSRTHTDDSQRQPAAQHSPQDQSDRPAATFAELSQHREHRKSVSSAA